MEYEKQLRLEISSLIQLIMVAFNSAHLSLPVARWYIQELFKVQERAAQFKVNLTAIIGYFGYYTHVELEYFLTKKMKEYQTTNILKFSLSSKSVLIELHVAAFGNTDKS